MDDLRRAVRLIDLHPANLPDSRPVLIFDGTYAAYKGMFASARTAFASNVKSPVGVDGMMLKGVLATVKKDESVTIKFTGTHMVIQRGTATSRLVLRSVDGDVLPGFGEYSNIFLAAPEPLRDALATITPITRSAARVSDVYALRGVKMTVRQGRLAIRATDTRNAVHTMIDIVGADGDKFEPVVPMEELATAISMMQGEVVLLHSGGIVALDDGTTTVAMAILQGTVPAFTQLASMPQDRRPVTLTREQIVGIDKLRVVMQGKDGIRLRCNDGSVKLFADGEHGESVVDCGVQDVDDFEINLSAFALRYALRIQDPVELIFHTQYSPFLVHAGDWYFWSTPIVR